MKNFLAMFASKNAIFKLVAVLLVITLLALSGFSRGKSALDDESSDRVIEADVTLRVDMHGWTPTKGSKSSTAGKAYKAPTYVAEAFEDEMRRRAAEERGVNPEDISYPVRIEWVRDKPISVSNEQMSEYFQLQLTKKTTPTIAFTWGTNFQDSGWYIDLTDYLQEENAFETDESLIRYQSTDPQYDPLDPDKRPTWSYSFEDYLWNLDSLRQLDNKVVAIPITLFAGTASAIIYNSDAIASKSSISHYLDSNGYLGVSEKFDYDDWMDMVVAVSGTNAKIIDTQNYPYTADSWLFQFELGPAYMSYFQSIYNAAQGRDANTRLSGQELLQAVMDDWLNPVQQDYVKELLRKVKSYMQYLDDTSTETQKWDEGKAIAKVAGSWAFTAETGISTSGGTFKYEMTPSTVIDSTPYTSSHVTWQKGISSAQPAADLYLNVMKAGVTKDGTLAGEIDQNKLRYAVEFLKCLTTKANNYSLISEMNTSLGSVKGVGLPPWVSTSQFQDCYFAKTDTVRGWPNGFTTSARTQMSTIMSKWVKDKMTDDAFFREWNEWQKFGAESMADALNIPLT